MHQPLILYIYELKSNDSLCSISKILPDPFANIGPTNYRDLFSNLHHRHNSIQLPTKHTIIRLLARLDFQNGIMSSLPYLTAWLLSFPVSIGSDWAIRTNKVSTRTSRMICNTFGLVFPALALVGLGFVRADQQALAVGILVAAVAGNIAIYCGHHANHMDLSPNFAGPLMGFTNAAANICSIVAPLVQGVIVQDAVSYSLTCLFLLIEI